MENVHLADEDDLYGGYNEVDPLLDTRTLQEDEGFQKAVRTSHGRRPIATAKLPGTAKIGTSRGGTGYHGHTSMLSSASHTTTNSQDSLARPMTAVRGVGYSSAGNRVQTGMFDPLNQAKHSVSPLQIKDENSPEELLKQLEKKVQELMEESCRASSRNEMKLALEKAKEASAKERALSRQREQLVSEASANMDLTFCVIFHLYVINLIEYTFFIFNLLELNIVGRLKVNIGNIYYNQGNYPKAIKFYRMALDQLPNTHKDMRIKIMKNIGLTFVKMGQFTDAITSFEYIMAEKPDFKTALHLILCHYSLGDREKMKHSFLKLLDVTLDNVDDDEKYSSNSEDSHSNLIMEAIKEDALRKIERKRRQEAESSILTAAKLIAPVILSSVSEGYEWCVQQINASSHAELANDLEINKAVMYLRKREFNQAIETLKMFEKKETKVASIAATNLSFLYFLQGDNTQADLYADQAIVSDRYNAGALVNKGNTCFRRGDLEKAKEFYKESLSNEASCMEALYNLGLTNKKLGNLEEALECFYKFHAIVRNHPQVVYEIASVYEMLEDLDQAMEWYQQLATLLPTDPHLLAKIGDMCEAEGDKQQAFQYHSDSYRYFPSNIEIIEWLGAYHIDSQVYEKAIKYFERAAIIQPSQVKWQLMVASCHRRSGNYQHALQTYKHIHKKFPENTECLKFLVRLCTDLGLQEAAEYAVKLKKAEKAKELKEQRVASNTSRPGSRHSSSRTSRDGSASSFNSAPPGTPHRSSSRNSLAASARSLDHKFISEAEEPFQPARKEIDASYEDPLGPQQERPKTAARRKDPVEDEFDNEELGDDLLPV
ncbi:intraflagellar transport protein 88 homolog [Centruroides sculpturatus]|uniref:intraflagellar transport protein 88 homolog n=1 Tax=Centruroides sculpturatus TaxID=218467 RepID=UPI000C6D5996|nr:intraflagellar transport protein 88 homolog [Centruroides sculpturatus]